MAVVPRKLLWRSTCLKAAWARVEGNARENKKERSGNESSKLAGVAVARDTRETLQLVAEDHQVTGPWLEAA
jgi:hypothetical protein